MNKKTNTIKLKGNEYATVATRLKEFRQDCPNGLIETKPQPQNDNIVMFTARILKDKSNPDSAEATGHSIGKIAGDKAFEKLETIAVGRALALLGYMASGEIASSDEMEEFLMYQNEKKQKMLEQAREDIAKLKTIDELRDYYMKNKGKGKELDQLLAARKQQITNPTENENS